MIGHGASPELPGEAMDGIRGTGRIGFAMAAAVAALLLGCATGRVPPSANVDWLLGTWQWHTHSRFEFVRDGDEIAWTMTRSRVLSNNPRWGEKAAVEVAGKVATVTSDRVEAFGTYERSDTPLLVGRRFRMWLTREGGAVLRGEIVGAGNEPIPVVLRKAPGP
jgi:hypothetical protein